MKKITVFICLMALLVLIYTKELSSNPSQSQTIRFMTTRNLSDGALKSSLLKQLQTLFQIHTFIETGTYLGQTTRAAAEVFPQVHSIELSQELYSLACIELNRYQNIHLHQGNSGELLKQLLASVPEKTLFYLDGHYSGGITAQGALNTPILEELDAIEKAKKKDSIILIDDIRLFQKSIYVEKIKKYSVEDYPDLSQLIEALQKINPSYEFCFLGDALLVFPRSEAVHPSPVLSACSLHRLSTVVTEIPEQLLEIADRQIACAQAEEKEELITYYQVYAPFELEYGYRSFATFWYGLLLKEQGNETEAALLLDQAFLNSAPNWRIHHFVK